MKKNDEPLYIIEDFPLLIWVSRAILGGWIMFATIKFQVNPLFFGITIAIAILLILIKYERSVIVRKDCIEIRSKALIPFLNRKKVIYYSSLKNISLEEYGFSFDLKTFLVKLIFNVSHTAFGYDKIVIDYKDGFWEKIICIGNRKENEILVQYIEAKLLQLQEADSK